MMKKFLSSLLALTMILSLVIVPARAANELTVTGLELSAKIGSGNDATDAPTTIANGTTVNFSITGTASVKEGETDVTISDSNTPTYKWSDNTTDSTFSKTFTTQQASETVTVSCDITYTVGEKSGTQKVSKTFTVTNAQAAFAAAIESIGFGGKDYPVSNGKVSVPQHNENEFASGTWSVNFKQGTGYTATASFNSNVLTITSTGGNGESARITVIPVPVTVTLSNPTYPTISKDGTTQITATYNGPETGVTYAWYLDNAGAPLVGQTSRTLTWTPSSNTAAGDHTFKCVVSYGEGGKIESDSKRVAVEDKTYAMMPSTDVTIYMAKDETDSETLANIAIYSTAGGRPVSDADYTYRPSDSSKVSVTSDGKITAVAAGTAKITITSEYKGKTYSKEISVVVSALEYTLDAVESGSRAQDYSMSTLKGYAEDVIATRLHVNSSSVTVNTLTAKSPAVSTIGKFETSSTYLTFTPPTNRIGKAQIVMTATTSALGSFDITFIIPVTPIKTTYESQYPQPSGTSSNYKYSVDVPDGYKEYYVVAKNPSKAPTDYSEKLSGTKSSYSGSSLYPLSGSDFDKSGKCELYVVTYDKDGTAYCGVINVYQKSYNIEYSVVAGESVTFDQKDFESFLEDIADDAGNYNSRKDTLELSYVKFSLPNSTREGVLYEGKSKIDRNDKVEDLDKVTFESVAKAKDTITISFTAYGKLYKDGASKGKDVDYSGNVVISVVKEDIVFEVGVNSAIKLGSDKFIDFLRDSDKSYKKADLDYVTFDVGKNSAITSYFNGTGALYRYYNGSTGINATVSAKDEFYYNPKTSSKHYDLDDVTYVTSKFAKVGDIVYIPFTAYGTKSGQKAEGTLAIKVKQTMNFVDVRPGDYFYDSVQWAVNLDITKGTSATTFSPKTGCTRAQIVTFLWRAAKSPEPRSNTSKFTDVYATAHADYMKAINWATEQGITTGTGNGKFSPDATCTRAQIVTFLYRFKSNPAVYGSLNFSDVNKTEHAAFYNAILWAVNNKITTGYGNGIFDPNGTCNRGDAVTFLYRALA